MWCCSPVNITENKRSKVADMVTSIVSDIVWKLTSPEYYTIKEQEDNILKFFSLIGKFKDLQSLAEKLLEYKKQQTLEQLKDAKTDDDEEKLESDTKKDKKEDDEEDKDALESLSMD